MRTSAGDEVFPAGGASRRRRTRAWRVVESSLEVSWLVEPVPSPASRPGPWSFMPSERRPLGPDQSGGGTLKAGV